MDNTNHTPEGRCPKCGAEWSGQPQSPSTSEVSDDMLDELNHWLSGHGACVSEDSKRGIISRLLAMKVADQSSYTSDCSALNLKVPATYQPATSLSDALGWLGQHRNAQLYWYGHIYGDDDREPEEWRVDLERGSINDREWETVGRGETPLAAIQSAMKSKEQSK